MCFSSSFNQAPSGPSPACRHHLFAPHGDYTRACSGCSAGPLRGSSEQVLCSNMTHPPTPTDASESGRDNAVGFHTDTRSCQGPISTRRLPRRSIWRGVCTGQMETGAVYSHRSRLAPAACRCSQQISVVSLFVTQSFEAFISGQASAEFTPAFPGDRACALPDAKGCWQETGSSAQ